MTFCKTGGGTHNSFHKIPYFSWSCCVKMIFYSAFVWKCIDMCKDRFGVQLMQNSPFCSSTFQTRKNIDKFGSQRTGRSFVRKLCCVFSLCRSREEQKPLLSKTRGLSSPPPIHGLYQSKPRHFTDYFIGGREEDWTAP